MNIYLYVGALELVFALVLIVCAARLYLLAREMEARARRRNWWLEREQRTHRSRL
jgi:hypothetical protein